MAAAANVDSNSLVALVQPPGGPVVVADPITDGNKDSKELKLHIKVTDHAATSVTSLHLFASPDLAAGDILPWFAKFLGWDVCEIRLVHRGSPMNIAQTFKEQCVVDGSTLHIVKQMRGS